MKVDLKNTLKAGFMALLVIAMSACGSDSKLIRAVVTGLSAGTLVLQNNGGDDLSITADGAYEFATKVDKGATYEVKVASGPYQLNCTVKTASGKITTDDVQVVVQCSGRAWHDPANITDHISPNTYDGVDDAPSVAMDSFGNAIVVWCQYVGDTPDLIAVYKSEFRNGMWTHPTGPNDFISPPGEDQDCGGIPRVAMDDNGDAIIVWEGHDGSHDHIYKSEYRDFDGDGTWEWRHPKSSGDFIDPLYNDDVPPTINETAAERPKVAMSNDGKAIIVYEKDDEAADDQVFVSYYNGSEWSHPVNTNDNISPDGENVDYPEVAMNDSGDAVVTWEQYEGSHWQIYKSEFRNGTWTHPADLDAHINPDTPAESTCDRPNVAIDNSGNTIIVWRQQDDSHYHAFMSEYRNSAWTHPADYDAHIDSDTDIDGLDDEDTVQAQVMVAMDNNGNAIIAWEEEDSFDDDSIFVSEYRSGAWTHPATIDANLSPDWTNADNPVVAMDNNGQAIVSWTQYDYGNDQEHKFRSEYRNGAWMNPVDYNDYHSPYYDDVDHYEGSVAMSDNGSAVIAWYGYQIDDNNYATFMSHYR